MIPTLPSLCLETPRVLVSQRRGSTTALIMILLPVLFALAAFAINIAHMETVNTDIQIAADAAVRAAGRTYAVTGDESAALAAAQEAATRNPIGDFVLPLTSADLEFGVSTRGNVGDPYTFTPTGSGNSVRLTTVSLSAGAGPGIEPVFPFFGSIFDIRPERSAVSTQGEIDIALVVDRSGSMAYGSSEVADYPPNPAAAPVGWDFGDPVPPGARWLDLIAAVQTFNTELTNSPQQELLSLSMYNHDSTTPRRLTNDYSLVIDKLDDVSMNFEAGGTNIGRGIYEALWAVRDASYARPHASKVIVLMTDGVHNYGDDPLWAADYAGTKGVTLFTITFSDEADQALMADVASRCGGEHFHAVTAAQLQAAFQMIARRLPTLLTQ